MAPAGTATRDGDRERARARCGRRARRASSGQSLAIFALTSVVIFASLGLALDAGVSYVAANRVERAAAAAALAGVTYMPGQLPTAKSAGAAAASRGGYTDGAKGVTVSVFPVPKGCDSGGSTATCLYNRLSATVTVPTGTTFLHILGLGTHTVSQTATAEYLSALTLGQPGAVQGNTAQQLTANQCCYMMRTEGWATDRGQGDAYTPNPADPGNPGLATSDIHTISGTLGSDYTTIGGFSTLPSQGGYNYQIVVPASTSNANVMVYNPAFAPNQTQDYHESDSITATDHSQYSVMEYTLFQITDPFNHLKDTPLAQMRVAPIDAVTSAITFTNAITGGKLSAAVVNATSIYHSWVDVFNPADYGPDSKGGHLISRSGGSLVTRLSAGSTYRLRVDTLDDQGNNPQAGSATDSAAHKGYAVAATLNSNIATVCTACSVGALDDMSVYTPVAVPGGRSAATFDIPLVSIPAQYAGVTVNFYVFDVGDVNGDTSNLLSVINPDTNIPSPPSASQTHVPVFNLGHSRNTPPVVTGQPGANEITRANLPAQRPDNNATIQTLWGCGNSDCYDGQWLLFKVTIPSGYVGDTAAAPGHPGGPFWNLRYDVKGTGAATDTFTMAVGYDGPPVHLVP